MKRIGVITIYTEPNYGSALQAYATQTILEQLGYDCKIIRYKYPNEWNHQQGYPKASVFRLFIRRLGLKYYHKKANKLKNFIKRKFNLTKEFRNLRELEQYDWNKNFDIVAVGSDQVWNYRYLYGDSAYLLSFLPDGFKRVSIASSFACKEIAPEYYDKYIKYLSKFSAFSVRESFGETILKKQLGLKQNIKVVLDPTLLLDAEQWLAAIKEKTVNRIKGKKYILLYGLYYAFEPRPYIFELLKYYKEQLGCEVVALEGYMRPKDCAGLKMIDCTDSSLYEFIYLFNHAEMVVTSSFHGTAFALNFSKPLVSVIPDNGIDDRLSSLLNLVGANNCAVSKGTLFESINPFYDTFKVESSLEVLRRDFKVYLQEMVGDNK